MKIELGAPIQAERELIRRMMQLYLYDFSEFEDTDLDEHAYYEYGDLDYFWYEATHAAFLVRVDGQLAGFVLVDNDVTDAANQRTITEFFVVRKYRRQGVGKQIAWEVFDRLPAKWEVQVIERNQPAKQFWRKVVAAYTEGKYRETPYSDDEWTGIVLTFDNRE